MWMSSTQLVIFIWSSEEIFQSHGLGSYSEGEYWLLGPTSLCHTHIEQETLMNKIKGDWERRAPQRAESKARRKCQMVSRVKCR